MVICLEQGADLHAAQLMPLPLTVSCSSKIQIGFTFLVPGHPGSPGQRAVKRACVCVSMVWSARCGAWLSGRNGTITSPGYPAGADQRGAGIECTWTIQVPRGHYVQLSFSDLRLDDPAAGGQCTADNFVQVRDFNETGASRPHGQGLF